MKKIQIIILAGFLMGIVNWVGAQTYTISNNNINTCSGTLYDSGGASGNYSNNESFQMFLCSDNGSTISLHFTQFNLASGDMLEIYNGDGVTNLLATGTGTSLNGQTISANVDCLTLVWTTTASGVAAGFAATINCATLCQGYTTDLVSNPPITDPVGHYIDICPGTTVNFTAVSNFLNNGSQGYTQSTASTTYHWHLTSGTLGELVNNSGLGLNTMSYTFNEPGGYTIELRSTDQIGCWNMGDATYRIRVSIPPNFAGTSLTPNPICPGQTVTLTGQVQTNPYEIIITEPQIVEECFYDNYEGTVCFQVSAFQPGQQITSANDVESFCITMEHSYIGDFYMYLRCPNGQEAMLHEYYNCNNAYFGLPNHSDNCAPGTGLEYCYSMSATQTVVNVCSSGASVPAGTYLPLGTYADLIGCPINGEWCVRFFDNWGADDGYIWSADLTFSPSILPQDVWGFENSYVLGQN
ncbi:MAG TPA: PKD domain-containing protein, partial [Bacteroidales bacterium]|nr:PKD domain-containing protein [Bacteroidales bacterium]